jgi:mono/diheme cytochrome c family protein
MKLRHVFVLAISAALLAACNFTLAADVTPPPGYVPPTAAPTLGPLFPASAPDPENGAVIFVEKCLPCHGETGLGDGPQSLDLPVSVIAIGLPDIASKAAPSRWYSVVTQGNLERFMPPFSSLTDQERWDVISYALTLHTTPAQLELGKNLFDANCDANCASKFTNLEMMSALSEDDIVNMIQNGEGAFGSSFTDEEAAAVAVYIRTLTFAAPPPTGTLQPTPTPVSATETSVSAEAGTPSAEGTLVDGTQVEVTPEATQIAGVGNVSGSIDNQTGEALPADLKVTLRGFEHGMDPSTGPQEIESIETTANADGTFVFENVDIPENRIYLAEVNAGGIPYQSEFAVVETGMAGLELAPITVYGTTEDFSVLQLQDLQFYFDYANEGSVQILAVYSIVNPTDKTVVVKVTGADEIPFIKMPEGITSQGYEASPDSAEFMPLDDGFAMPPSETPYGLIAFASVPKEDTIDIEQPVLLPVTSVMMLVPTGVTIEGEGITDNGPHEFNGGTFNMYSGEGIEANGKINFTLSGEPKSTAVNPDLTQNQTLLIGIGTLGLALILAGAWMYWRDRKRTDEDDDDDDDEDELEDPDSIMDAIIALDELHRAGKMSDEAYRKRRDELKNSLKRKG